MFKIFEKKQKAEKVEVEEAEIIQVMRVHEKMFLVVVKQGGKIIDAKMVDDIQVAAELAVEVAAAGMALLDPKIAELAKIV